MNLKNLSDSVLLAQTKNAALKERKSITLVLNHLLEVERRRLYLELGYGSLFDYCLRELHYSEGSAQRRISSMRLLREIPEVESKIESGELSLSVISQAQVFFRAEKSADKRRVLKS